MYSFILTFLAGISTMMGIIPIFFKNKDNFKIIRISCAFAAGVMMCISILDLIPESIRYLDKYYNGLIVIILSFIFILLGIIVSNILDKIVNKYSNNNLYNIGILSLIVIVLHNIPEGIITYIVSNKSILLGLSICIGIAIHNIPEGISIAIPIYYSTKSKIKAILYTLIASLAEPLGALITYLFLKYYINDIVLGILFSFIGGIMLEISFSKLLPVGINTNKKDTYKYFILGFIIMIISLLLNSLIY